MNMTPNSITYRIISGTDLKLSSLGFGCHQLSGFGWGKVSEGELVEAVYAAIDLGITLFDTAPIYGLGYSEKLLGKTLGHKRKDVILATKVGLVWDKSKVFRKWNDNSSANILREIDQSLKNLRTDYIDIYQIHWPDLKTPLSYTLETMQLLKKSGKIRAIGCCNFSLEQLKEAVKWAKITTVQIPYNLVDRKDELGIMPFCKENGINVLIYSPIARGLLSGKYNQTSKFGKDDHRGRSTDAYFAGDNYRDNLKMVRRIEKVAVNLNKLPTQVALRWVLENPQVTSAIFGVKNVKQLKENMGCLNFQLSDKDMIYLSKKIKKDT